MIPASHLLHLETKEQADIAKDEWTVQWVGANRGNLIAGELDTDLAVMLAEVDYDQSLALNHCLFLLMTECDSAPLQQFMDELIDETLVGLADDAWKAHLAELEDGSE